MRIAVLTHMVHPVRSPYSGGLEMHTAMTVTRLVRAGHDVTVYARRGTEFDVPVEVVPVLPAEGHADEASRDAGTADACARVLDSDAEAVLNNSLSRQPLLRLRDLPMLTVLHTPPTIEPVLAVLDEPGWTAPNHHRWASVSAANALAWRHRLPQTDVVPNGIELHRWRSDALPVPGRAVWTGRITQEKGLHLALDAARMAGMELHFAGPLSDPAYFEREIRPRLGAGTRYHGHLDHRRLPDLLATGEVYLATPLWAEPFGLATVEAMAMGVPVAALLTGAMGEIVPQQAGELAVHHTAEALADAAGRARGRDRAAVLAWACGFDADTMVAGYEELLVEACQALAVLVR